MKIKIYIVTYKNEKMLKANIDSILKSDITLHDYSITVINNFTSKFELSEYCIENNINLLNNNLRVDFSTGHLSRSWNQAIIHGFKSLENSDCDILVVAQDDNIFFENWSSYIIEQHKTYDFITMGCGDQYHSYTKNHIKNVGLWDERFCNIGYQEYDYFIRSFLHNKEKTSLNDRCGKILHNPIENYIIDDSNELVGAYRISLGEGEDNKKSQEYHHISRKILQEKWGNIEHLFMENTWKEYFSNFISSKISNFIYYPYFEKDINYSNKNYTI